MIRKSTHTIEEVTKAFKDLVLASISKKNKPKVDFYGDKMKATSQRYQVFFGKGMICVKCGIEGKFFAKERHETDRTYHLNLYAIDENGEEVLMTKDHIIPKSKGGKNSYENYQCMCARCNMEKGDKEEF